MPVVIRPPRRRLRLFGRARIEHVITSSSRANNLRRGMTLAELATFLRVAQQLGLPQDTNLRAIVGWSGQLRQVTAEGVATPPPAPRPNTTPWRMGTTTTNPTPSSYRTGGIVPGSHGSPTDDSYPPELDDPHP